MNNVRMSSLHHVQFLLAYYRVDCGVQWRLGVDKISTQPYVVTYVRIGFHYAYDIPRLIRYLR